MLENNKLQGQKLDDVIQFDNVKQINLNYQKSYMQKSSSIRDFIALEESKFS